MIKFPLSREGFLQINRSIQQGLLSVELPWLMELVKNPKVCQYKKHLTNHINFRHQKEETNDGRVSEDQPAWVVNAHLVLHKIIETVRNIPLATVFCYIFAAAMGILKIFSIPKDKTRERDELKEKVEEIKYAKPKEIEHHKWKLKEQVFFSRFIKTIVSFILDKL